MSLDLKMWDLGPSPNSTKVRLALGFKGLEYERIPVDPQDRAEIVEVSGQPLTPVLKHGDTVVYDSNAILRYLDANVKREPRLYAEDLDTMRRIEAWESWTRGKLGPPTGLLFGQFFAEQRDETVLGQARQLLAQATAEIEAELESSEALVGDSITAADIQPAAFLSLAYLSPEKASSHPVLEFFKTHYSAPASHERTEGWFRRVIAFDR